MKEYIVKYDPSGLENGEEYDYHGDYVGELIRCKDCKHFTGKWCILNSGKEFDPNDRLVNGEGFCAWAERKTNENT